MKSITEDKLIDYILGLSSESERTMIETQMLTSSSIQERIAQLRDLWVLPGLACQEVQPSSELHSRILESVDSSSSSFEGFVDRLGIFLDLSGQRVRELLARIGTAENSWDQSGIPGVLMYHFTGGSRHLDNECALVWMKPGAVFPSHGHLGDEWGFVLQGEAREDDGQVSKPGDIVYRTPDNQHSITAISEKPFIFVVIHQGIHFC